MDFTGKKVVITGASCGIGRAAALRFCELHADVAMLDINLEQLKSVQREAEAFGVRVLAYKCDVSSLENVNEVFDDIMQKFGQVDILVNSAALWRSYYEFNDIPLDEWGKFISINLMGVVYTTRCVLDKMYKNNYGRIINVASVAGDNGNRLMAHYSATKAAVISLTRSLAKEAAEHNVTANCVSPGTVSPSDILDIDYFEPNELNYMGRTGTDRENAELICFIASKEAAYISGQNILIDGCRKKL